MAVLIPDLEMPKSCVECPCCYDNYFCEILKRNFFDRNKVFDFTTERLPKCPLVEAVMCKDCIFLHVPKKGSCWCDYFGGFVDKETGYCMYGMKEDEETDDGEEQIQEETEN